MLVNLRKVNVQEWVKNPQNIYIGRKTEFLEASKWANPFAISYTNNRESVVSKFEQYIRNNCELLKDIQELKGKNLGCWCHPKRCHGTVLKQLLQETMESESDRVTVTSTATFTTTVSTNVSSIMSAQATGTFSPLPFSSKARTRSSTGTQLKSTYMRLKVSPDKTPISTNILTTTSPSSNSESATNSAFTDPRTSSASSPTPVSSPTIDSKSEVSPTNNNAGEQTTTSDLINSRLSSLEQQLREQYHINMMYAETISKLEKRVDCLEGELMLVNSRLCVRDHIVDGLRGEIHRLQQYTRRYSVSIAGIEKTTREETHDELKEKVLKVVNEVTSSTKEADIDKFHRNGPVFEGNRQEVILRFKSHSAKEAFYRGRKTLPPASRAIKIKPSLSPHQRKLLREAEALIEEYRFREEMINPPEFVFANIHGEIQVKLKKKYRHGDLVTFHTIKQLVSILYEAQKVKETDLAYENLYERFHENPQEVSLVAAAQDSDDMGFDLYT